MNDDSERIRFVPACRPVALAGILLLASGCAALSDGLSPDTGTHSSPIELVSLDQSHSAAAEPTSSTSADSISEPSASDVIAQAVPTTGSKSKSNESAKPEAAPPKDAPDDFYDPFAKKEDLLSVEEDYDPWEGFNSVMFKFNRKFDKYLLKPVATAYDKIIPTALQKGISNFYYNNIYFGPRLLNNVFQLKFEGAGIELSRFVINNVIGLAGFFDPAKHWLRLETPQEDSGQTLGSYGVPPGPYLVLPFLPPFTLRDFFGYLLDFAMNPVNYFLFPTSKVGNRK